MYSKKLEEGDPKITATKEPTKFLVGLEPSWMGVVTNALKMGVDICSGIGYDNSQ